ncbi:hypothetical protein REPUB_Repub01dG0085700 [Reevesia pubescens]
MTLINLRCCLQICTYTREMFRRLLEYKCLVEDQGVYDARTFLYKIYLMKITLEVRIHCIQFAYVLLKVNVSPKEAAKEEHPLQAALEVNKKTVLQTAWMSYWWAEFFLALEI